MALQPILDEIMNGSAAAPMHMRITQRVSKQWQHLCTCALLKRILKKCLLNSLNISDGAATHSWWDHERSAAAPMHMRITQRVSKQLQHLCTCALLKRIFEKCLPTDILAFSKLIVQYIKITLIIHVVCNRFPYYKHALIIATLQ